MKIKKFDINLKAHVGQGYDELLYSKKRYIACKGSRGSKKSCTVALRYIYMMMYYYFRYNARPNLLVIRRYMNTNWNSTRAQLIWAIEKMGVGMWWKIPKSEHTLTFLPSNQQILFRGLDDAQSITSITVETGSLCWVWINFIGPHVLNSLNCWNSL